VKLGLRLGLLAAVAVALGVVYFALARSTAPAATGFLFRFGSGDRLTEIRIANQNGTVTLAREGDQWVITEPGRYRANQQKAALIEDFLLNLPVKRQLDRAAPEYGLDQPLARIEMTSASGAREALIVGSLTASKAQVYLQDGRSGGVFVSDLGSVTQFDGSLDAYRDKEVFSVDKNNITGFSYFVDGEKKVTAQRVGEDWQLTYPYDAPAREIEISEFLISLRKWSAIMYPPRDGLDYAGLGLDRPREALEVVDADGKTQRIELGAEADGLRFVRSGSEEDVAGIFAVDIDFSTLDAAQLVAFQPLRATIDQVASIEIATGNRPVTFTLDHATDPPGVTANGRPVPYDAFVSLFVRYIALSADGFDSVARPGAATLSLTTTYLDGQTTRAELLARDSDTKYLRASDREGFYLSDKKAQALLDKMQAALGAGE
jgi:hypothetical protein